MSFGDEGGAIGYLVGELNKGLGYMFTMMNHARLGVGVEGMAISERAYQHAVAYARDRVQSRELGSPNPASAAIIKHPDVRRMLMTMRAQIEAQRALAYYTATALDRAATHPHPEEKARNQALVNFLIPIVKGWNTEQANEITSLGVQVHGGMGFIEETGAAQYYRDARITAIYEGTTGIQALDLIGRKLASENGVTAPHRAGRSQSRGRPPGRRRPRAASLPGRAEHRRGTSGNLRGLCADPLCQQPAPAGSRLGALPQADGYCAGRLANGPRRPRRPSQTGRRRC